MYIGREVSVEGEQDLQELEGVLICLHGQWKVVKQVWVHTLVQLSKLHIQLRCDVISRF